MTVRRKSEARLDRDMGKKLAAVNVRYAIDQLAERMVQSTWERCDALWKATYAIDDARRAQYAAQARRWSRRLAYQRRAMRRLLDAARGAYNAEVDR